MYKALIVAMREYSTAVRSKGFIVGVILMPILMSAGFIAQKMTQNIADTTTYAVAILDRTPGGGVASALSAQNEKRNAETVIDKATGKQIKPKFDLQITEPAPPTDAAAVDQQRLALSEKCRTGELLAFVEIGEKVTDGKYTSAVPTSMPASGSPMNAMTLLESRPDELVIRYTTNRPTFSDFRDWLQEAVTQPIFLRRLASAQITEQTLMRIKDLSMSVIVVNKGLATQSATGTISYAKDKAGQITSILVPVVLLMLMFIVVLTGTSPMTTNVLEEKQMRIAEVLLGGLRPFELMLGKLLGGVGVALTLAAIYIGGAVGFAMQFDALQYVQPHLLVMFTLFTILAVCMFGAVFLAAGAAVTNVKEAQAIIGPVMILIVGPMSMFGQILEYPSGGIARFLTFFPPSAPLVTVMRCAIPPGIAWWEIAGGAISSIIGTLIVVWLAGRVFRVGLLSNSRPSSFKEAVRWITTG